MPYDDPDPDDPMTLVGAVFEAEDDSSTRAMAECFVEEFVRMGLPPDQILEMFRQPSFAAMHDAYHTLGEGPIQELIDAYSGAFRPIRIIDAPGAMHRPPDWTPPE